MTREELNKEFKKIFGGMMDTGSFSEYICEASDEELQGMINKHNEIMNPPRTDLSKAIGEILDDFSKKLTVKEMIEGKDISNQEMRKKLEMRGWTREKCFSEEHYDVDEKWLNEIFA